MATSPSSSSRDACERPDGAPRGNAADGRVERGHDRGEDGSATVTVSGPARLRGPTRPGIRSRAMARRAGGRRGSARHPSSGDGGLDVHVRLDDATIETGFARLAKPAGAPGKADARLTLARNAVTRVERARRRGGSDDRHRHGDATGHGWDERTAGREHRRRHPCDARRGTLHTDASIGDRAGTPFRLTSDDAGALLPPSPAA